MIQGLIGSWAGRCIQIRMLQLNLSYVKKDHPPPHPPAVGSAPASTVNLLAPGDLEELLRVREEVEQRPEGAVLVGLL